MNLSMEQKQIHIHREQTSGCQGRGVGGGKDWEISRCKPVYREWIFKKMVLLHSMGNYIQHPVINQNGKENKKECICLYY